uniref:Putative secreted protein n=1 Tax=Anopheles triannulatus TaxID=58253 RepID=A0A2M4B6P3_9DIPT
MTAVVPATFGTTALFVSSAPRFVTTAALMLSSRSPRSLLSEHDTEPTETTVGALVVCADAWPTNCGCTDAACPCPCSICC